MLPDYTIILSILLAVTVIVLIAYVLPRRLDYLFEATMIILLLIYIYVRYDYADLLILFAFGSTLYAHLTDLFNKEKLESRRQLRQELENHSHIELDQSKDRQRIFYDLSLTVLVLSLALIFLLWAPESYILIKFFILLYLLHTLNLLLNRLGNYYTTRIYWLPESKRLVVLSFFESRDLPMKDLENLYVESQPDILRLHPLFTFLSQNQDYTSSLGPVLRLDFPGEHIYFSPIEPKYWQGIFTADQIEADKEKVKRVDPIWHPANMKRLLWKGYFAITVKGISAYTGLLFLLLLLKVPALGIVLALILWWIFNLYVSDRVLIASADATAVTEGDLYELVKGLSKAAKINQPAVYLIDSPVYNGLAMGMNIGRGTIMITSATMNLPEAAVEAILAHELAHIKNRDILINQLARALFFLVLAGSVYLFFDQIQLLAEHYILLLVIVYILMTLFPIYLSLVSQYCEMRADFWAGQFLQNRRQVSEGLRSLGQAQERALTKSLSYSQRIKGDPKKEAKRRGVLHRGPWYLRLLEFQFMPHPPLYFRIRTMKHNISWRGTIKHWLRGRHSESIPDRLYKGKAWEVK